MHEVVPGARTEGTVLPQTGAASSRARSKKPGPCPRRVGMFFQKPHPLPAMSVRDNVLAGLRLRGIAPPDPSRGVEEALSQAHSGDDVKDALDRPAGRSPAEKQARLCIAR